MRSSTPTAQSDGPPSARGGPERLLLEGDYFKRPGKRAMELIRLYLMGYAQLDEVVPLLGEHYCPGTEDRPFQATGIVTPRGEQVEAVREAGS